MVMSSPEAILKIRIAFVDAASLNAYKTYKIK